MKKIYTIRNVATYCVDYNKMYATKSAAVRRVNNKYKYFGQVWEVIYQGDKEISSKMVYQG